MTRKQHKKRNNFSSFFLRFGEFILLKKLSMRQKACILIPLWAYIILLVLFFNHSLQKQGQTYTHTYIKTLEVTTSPLENQVSVTPSQRKSPTYRLERNDGNTRAEILTLPSQIIRWQNFLFYVDQTSQKLMSYDLTNKKATVMYRATDSGIKSRSSYDKNIFLGDLTLINNTLFFSVTVEDASSRNGATYALDLPNKASPVWLIAIPGKVEKMNDTYFIVRVDEGDTCGGRTTYATLDIATKKALKIAETWDGCSEGQSFIDVDSQGRMLLGYQTGSELGAPLYGNLGLYTSLFAIPLSNPSIKESIIAQQNMPQGITSIHYLKKRNQLLLVGKSAFLVDLSTNMLSKLFDLPSSWNTVWIDSIKGDSACVLYLTKKQSEEQSHFYSGAEINLLTNQLIEKSTICPQKLQTNDTTGDGALEEKSYFQKQIKDLHLPSNYQLIYH